MTKLPIWLDNICFFFKLCWYIIVNKNKATLMRIKREIESLPNSIWTDEDFRMNMVDDAEVKQINKSRYDAKRKVLNESVMHIGNKIQAYVRLEFGDTSELLKEFNSYSFSPRYYIVNSFNKEANNCWYRGKCEYLYFIDKLIDEMQIRNGLKALCLGGIYSFLMYVVILGVLIFYIFINNTYIVWMYPLLDSALKKILLFLMASILSFVIVRPDEKKFIIESLIVILLVYLPIVFL